MKNEFKSSPMFEVKAENKLVDIKKYDNFNANPYLITECLNKFFHM